MNTGTKTVHFCSSQSLISILVKSSLQNDTVGLNKYLYFIFKIRFLSCSFSFLLYDIIFNMIHEFFFFSMVLGGIQWCLVVFSEIELSRHCQMQILLSGNQWYSVVSSCIQWYPVVSSSSELSQHYLMQIIVNILTLSYAWY